MEHMMKYACFILFIITRAVALPSGDINKEALDKAEAECEKELNTTDVLLQQKSDEELSRISACRILCVGNKIGYIYENVTFNIDKTLQLAKAVEEEDKKIDPDILKTILEYCNKNHETSKDKCLTSQNLFICLTEKLNENGILHK